MENENWFELKVNKRIFMILLVVALMVLSSVFTMGYEARAFEDTKTVLDALGWWKIQRDCSQCDAWTCQATTQSLQKFNISGLKNGG